MHRATAEGGTVHRANSKIELSRWLENASRELEDQEQGEVDRQISRVDRHTGGGHE